MRWCSLIVVVGACVALTHPVRAGDLPINARDFESSPQVIASSPWDIGCVVTLADQESICTGYDDGGITVWSLEPNRPLQRLVGHAAAVTALDVDAAGRLVSASQDGTVRIWNMATGETELTLRGSENWLTCCAISQDGRWAAAGGYDRALFLWRVDQPGSPPTVLEHGDAAVLAVAFSNDGRLLTSGASDGTVRLWTMSAEGPSVTPVIYPSDNAAVNALVFDPDGAQLVIGHESGAILLRPVEWREAGAELGEERRFDCSSGVVSMRWLLPEGMIVAGTMAGDVQVLAPIENSQGRAERAFLSGHRGPVNGVTTLRTARGPVIVSVSEDRSIQLWRTKLPATPAIAVVPVPDVRLWSIAVSESANCFAVGGREGYLAIHDLKSGEQLYVVEGLEETVDSLNFSSDGALLAVSSWKLPVVTIVDVATGALQQTFPLEANGRQVHFTPDNRGVFVACDDDRTVQRIELAGMKQSVVVSELDSYAVDVSPDGGMIAVGSGDWQQERPGELNLYLAENLTHLAAIDGHQHAVRWVAFHPTEAVLASADETGVVIVWDLITRSELHRLANPDGCKPVAFSPDGNLLAVGLKDGTIQVWDWRTEELVQRMATDDDVFDLVFSPDGTSIMAVNGEREFYVWALAGHEDSGTALDASTWIQASETAE